MTGTNRKRHLTSLATVVVLAISGSVLSGCGTEKPSTGTASHEIHAMASHSSDSTQTALYAGMRTLWAQHMEWTYATVIAFAGDSPALDASIKRLLRNQTDIGNAIAPFYGNRAGKRLSALLTVHIEEAVPVLSAAKAGDSDALNTAVADWYANARDIADFLASANPHWKRTEMRHMMRAHITQTIGYASDILGGKHSRAVKKYDAAEAHMADMADMLSQGLVQQFPGKF